jgi:hypothetical protein
MEKQLSAEQKAKLIEKYRDINVDWNDWHEWVIEQFKEDMAAIGIDVNRVHFTGFWSQGDGACFDGKAVFPKFMDNFGADKYPMIRKLLGLGGTAYFGTKHRGHYYHENCVEYSYEIEAFEQVMDSHSEFQGEVIKVFQEQLDIEAEQFEEDALEFFKDKMREVYSNLRKAYEYDTEDEQVWETIVANDLHLNIDDEE